MRFTIKQLEYIYQVLTTENVSRAAKKCFISQPAMTQCLREFEEENKVLLFERRGGRLNITPEGEEIHKELAVLLLAIRDFEERLLDIAQKSSGKITVGIPPVILTVYFYDIISSFMSKNPLVDLEILELGANELKKTANSRGN
ncbi:LysR family transcriptional regulator [Listeria floridensis FSL S10-1187]|uniref:LysR family transcriptional regulator n=1 Tax=Listeria floridensis FSL S10-1187 TaxID=1265817 RepID=A0ABN0RID2_9LIST|nr:LysR family transcriptional regulator [Listeria floridensis]EUJ33712.1 LysR family transcriptional regulator [Listeria floridensis FSL S10-1187]